MLQSKLPPCCCCCCCCSSCSLLLPADVASSPTGLDAAAKSAANSCNSAAAAAAHDSSTRFMLLSAYRLALLTTYFLFLPLLLLLLFSILLHWTLQLCFAALLLRCSLCLSLFLPSLHQHHLMKKIVLNGEGIGMLKPDWFHSFSEWESIMIACLIDWWSYTLANRIECCKS